jgi:thioredoxin-dependent peroxiredoxin
MKEGDRAPDFELRNQDGEAVKLSDYAGRTVVLYFYPKADTPGCTAQACGIRDHLSDYEEAGAVVLGVSPDQPEELRRFADKYSLPFTLLADVRHEVAERYGVWAELSFDGHKFWGNERSTFLIDGEGRIARTFHSVSPTTHDELLLGALAELRQS